MSRPSKRVDLTTLLDRVEDISEPDELSQTLAEVISTHAEDGIRALIECYERSVWRQSKIEIIRALGNTSSRRSLEFLLTLAEDKEDLNLAAEALLSLGATDSIEAGDYLLKRALNTERPLAREAILALALQKTYPYEKPLFKMLEDGNGLSRGVEQYLILALGKRSYAALWGIIKDTLTNHQAYEDGMLFNSCLVASEHTLPPDEVKFLDSLNTRYRFFADHLKINASERCRLIARDQPEDLLQLLAAADCPEARATFLYQLRRYPAEAVLDALNNLSEDLTEDDRLLVSVVAQSEGEEDEKITRMFSALRSKVWGPGCEALLVSLLPSKKFKKIWSKSKIEDALLLTSRASLPQLAPRLIALLAEEEDLSEHGILAVNTLVTMAQLCPESSEYSEIAVFLRDTFKRSSNRPLQHRCLRALGQIGAADQGLVPQVANLWKNDPKSYGTFCYYLGKLGTAEANSLIIKKMKAEIQREKTDLKIIRELTKALSRSPLAPALKWSDQESLDLLKSCPKWTLRLLSVHEISGASKNLPAVIQSADSSLKLAALAASILHWDEFLEESVVKVFGEMASPAASKRAAYGIALKGAAKAKATVIERLFGNDHCFSKGDILSFLRNFEVDSTRGMSGLMVAVEAAKTSSAATEDSELGEALNSISEQLQLVQIKNAASTKPSTQETGSMVIHQVDQSIKEVMNCFDNMSETIRAVLRNAEVTFRRTDLFSDEVDKSTVIIEYTKSIDLLLQERLGQPMFLAPSGNIIGKMQARSMLLDLDDERISSAQRVSDLSCANQFSAERFPSHKLASIGKLIMSGKLVRDQFKAIDGLRAWSLMLLVFGRKYKFKDEILEPILPISGDSSLRIAKLARELNDLQELRNQAAHRGTLLALGNLAQIRSDSLEILGALNEIVAA